jgi:hypothetical protein
MTEAVQAFSSDWPEPTGLSITPMSKERTSNRKRQIDFPGYYLREGFRGIQGPYHIFNARILRPISVDQCRLVTGKAGPSTPGLYGWYFVSDGCGI